jgi:hypothetical protein
VNLEIASNLALNLTQEAIRKACNGISLELMKINPAVPALGDKEAQDEIYRTVFELTKEVETIKKRLAKLERSDESRDL